MARAGASVNVTATPERVWQLIGGFGSLPDWLPFIRKSELSEGGRVRHLASANGETMIERLEKFDNTARNYSYSIIQAPFRVKDYLSTLRVQSANGGKSSTVEWTGQFTPAGATDPEVSNLFQGIYEDGLKALAAQISSERK